VKPSRLESVSIFQKSIDSVASSLRNTCGQARIQFPVFLEKCLWQFPKYAFNLLGEDVVFIFVPLRCQLKYGKDTP
jgi:hypothetical protein